PPSRIQSETRELRNTTDVRDSIESVKSSLESSLWPRVSVPVSSKYFIRVRFAWTVSRVKQSEQTEWERTCDCMAEQNSGNTGGRNHVAARSLVADSSCDIKNDEA
ncbi:hypothetical protein HN011_004595, partial [Eciton burchellii]